ncbi:copper resistance CopC family protein [Alkalihalophilus marmarensis]|uniref:copper resistance CopC family protein n=1 Tax=Alkalihalophilus marmarensis TaxID=521377 RepID=UPI002DB5D312|nr:copper resistance protein CopC [Alkalihalophilus marmarensis]MEC2074409.1 copper resistance protein CopC [Alkalihalophilus marmarensis]
MKKFLFFFIFMTLFYTNSALAHTSLEQSSPADGDVLAHSPSDIFLEFNTRIEQGSKFQLFTSNNDEVALEDIAIDDNILIGVIPNELQNGVYMVNWNIIGADGHPIEGTYSFTVDGKEDSLETMEPEQEETPAIRDYSRESPMEESSLEEPIQEPQSTLPVTLMIVSLVLVATGSLLLLLRKGKN